MTSEEFEIKEERRMWEPMLKKLSCAEDDTLEKGMAVSTVGVARRMPELCLGHANSSHIRARISAKMKTLGLPSEVVIAYVNFAGHNTLNIRELAQQMGVNKFTIVRWFRLLRQEWPQLFSGGQNLEAGSLADLTVV